MSHTFDMKMADINIRVNYRNQQVYDYCKDYIVSGVCPDMTVSVSDAQIKAEMKASPNCAEWYCETLCIYRNIAEQLPLIDRAVFHGACISYQGSAYLFTAPSGTGKSTHIALWRKYIGNAVGIVNGDKPILKIDDTVTVYGTPWAGKEAWQKNTSAPLSAICVISRGTSNTVRRLTVDECINALMCQIYLPKDAQALSSTIGLLGRLIENIPVYTIECDISEQAVKSSFDALTGQTYQGRH